ncbi:chaperone modulator CbpM [Thiohalobacter sp. IOR34]|uniref:chaperone modulator CbpM n=1 Tax=Thiohalobacter sp. IOR34 TaxID=3057176 RepID=UPI0025B1BC8D|nr:chaperone modulator CbpM [Thiohalobacter sp. IOR34]WJW75819.1 chaperone modulator CbpM [Thiohalobacter sp. IOR34]
MVRHEEQIITAVLLDEEQELSIGELAEACQIHAERLLEMVEEGVLRPCGGRPGRWRFRAAELQRARTALRLQQDLDINLAGVALAIELLDEVQQLRRRVRSLEQRLGISKPRR